MHTTLASAATAWAFASLLSRALGNDLDARQTSYCVHDDLYDGLWDNPEIAYDVNTFCVSLLSLSPTTVYEATTTPRTTVAETTVTTGVSIGTVTAYISTSTVVESATVLGMKAKRNAQPAITPRVEFEPVRGADALAKRQGTDAGLAEALSSACGCGPVNPGTDYQTITEQVIGRAAVTSNITVYDPVTTTTVVQNVTSNIVSAINTTSFSNTWTGSWAYPYPTNSTTAVTSSSTAGPISASSTAPSTTSALSGSSTTSTTASSSTVSPSGCPGINGTTYPSSGHCVVYQRICARSYNDADFYNSEEYYDSPESCASVCDAENSGAATPCLGIDWNLTAVAGMPNCRQLRTLNDPIGDSSAIALILIPDPACATTTASSALPAITNSTTSVPSSTSMNMATASNSTSWQYNQPSRTAPWRWNHNSTWGYPTGYATGHPTGHPTGYPTGSGAHSYSYNSSTSTTNATVNATSIPTSSGTNPVGPVTTNATTNSSCVTSTAFVAVTYYATLFQTTTLVSNFTSTITITSDLTVTPDPVTVMSTETDVSTVTTTETDTVTTTDFSMPRRNRWGSW